MLYFDHAATSPARRQVLESMWPYLTTEFGNPSSVHEVGRRASVALESARERVAAHLGCRASEIIFTSGGTESDNLALWGLAAGGRISRVITSRVEHEAVLETVQALSQTGVAVSMCEVDSTGIVEVGELERVLATGGTRSSSLRASHSSQGPEAGGALVSLMHANNEVGSVQQISELARVAHQAGAIIHTDAVQTAGSLPLVDLGVDALSISGHKLGTPKGIGALMVRGGNSLSPQLLGGGQERGRRSGTQNVAGAVGLATALDLCQIKRPDPDLRDDFIARVLNGTSTVSGRGARLTGGLGERRLPSHASFIFEQFSGEAMLLEMESHGLVASSGSACAAGRSEPSHVLLACGFSESESLNAVRFSWGNEMSADGVVRAADIVLTSWRSLRERHGQGVSFS